MLTASERAQWQWVVKGYDALVVEQQRLLPQEAQAMTLEAITERAIAEALIRHAGNKLAAARDLAISPRTIQYHLAPHRRPSIRKLQAA